jgi:hypothetical protein
MKSVTSWDLVASLSGCGDVAEEAEEW